MNKDYYIMLGDEEILVTEEVYKEYMRPVWRENKKCVLRAENEISFESLTERGREPEEVQRIAENIEDKLLLNQALAELTAGERRLIEALFFECKSERQVSAEMGITQSTLNYRKSRLIKLLKNYLQNV